MASSLGNGARRVLGETMNSVGNTVPLSPLGAMRAPTKMLRIGEKRTLHESQSGEQDDSVERQLFHEQEGSFSSSASQEEEEEEEGVVGRRDSHRPVPSRSGAIHGKGDYVFHEYPEDYEVEDSGGIGPEPKIVTYGPAQVESYTFVGADVEEEGDETLSVLVSTGNPGFVRAYYRFGAGLSQLMPEAHIEMIGMPGHSFRDENNGKIYGLADAVATREAQLEATIFRHRKEGSNKPVVLIGHSIGAWIWKRVMLERPDLARHVVRFIALFPSLDHLGDRVSPVLKFVALPPVMSLIGATVSALPGPVTALLKRIVKPDEVEYIDQVEIRGSLLTNIGQLLRDELDMLNAMDIEGVQAVLPKTSWLFTPSDKYNPEYPELMRARWPHADIHVLPPHVTHAFVNTNSQVVARVVARVLHPHLDSDDSEAGDDEDGEDGEALSSGSDGESGSEGESHDENENGSGSEEQEERREMESSSESSDDGGDGDNDEGASRAKRQRTL